MKVMKFKRRIEIDKRIGNFHIETFHYGSYNATLENDKPEYWTELHCWYNCDCAHCPLCWEDRSYWGECNDSGCYMAEYPDDYPKILVCMLPDWIKRILLRRKGG